MYWRSFQSHEVSLFRLYMEYLNNETNMFQAPEKLWTILLIFLFVCTVH